MKPNDTYHHGHLREELLRLGLEALETEGADVLSLRSLSERAGVSKTAPYRHFRDKDAFLGALADEGFRLLHIQMELVSSAPGPTTLAEMGRVYMDFAVAHPALYRLMSSSLVCTLPSEFTQWARRSFLLLARSLKLVVVDGKDDVNKTAGEKTGAEGVIDIDATVAAWAYIHGLVTIRIDGLFPADLPEPNWDRLAGIVPSLLDPKN
ncbi:MAG: TetR/AcrR family transcriptional regulator [Spirochaetota bacterium]